MVPRRDHKSKQAVDRVLVDISQARTRICGTLVQQCGVIQYTITHGDPNVAQCQESTLAQTANHTALSFTGVQAVKG